MEMNITVWVCTIVFIGLVESMGPKMGMSSPRSTTAPTIATQQYGNWTTCTPPTGIAKTRMRVSLHRVNLTNGRDPCSMTGWLAEPVNQTLKECLKNACNGITNQRSKPVWVGLHGTGVWSWMRSSTLLAQGTSVAGSGQNKRCATYTFPGPENYMASSCDELNYYVCQALVKPLKNTTALNATSSSLPTTTNANTNVDSVTPTPAISRRTSAQSATTTQASLSPSTSTTTSMLKSLTTAPPFLSSLPKTTMSQPPLTTTKLQPSIASQSHLTLVTSSTLQSGTTKPSVQSSGALPTSSTPQIITNQQSIQSTVATSHPFTSNEIRSNTVTRHVPTSMAPAHMTQPTMSQRHTYTTQNSPRVYSRHSSWQPIPTPTDLGDQSVTKGTPFASNTSVVATAGDADDNLEKPVKEQQNSATPIGSGVAVLVAVVLAIVILVVCKKRQQRKLGLCSQHGPVVLQNNLAADEMRQSNCQNAHGAVVNEPDRLQDGFQGSLEDAASTNGCSILNRAESGTAITESSYAAIDADNVKASSSLVAMKPTQAQIDSCTTSEDPQNQSTEATGLQAAAEHSHLESVDKMFTYESAFDIHPLRPMNQTAPVTFADASMDQRTIRTKDESADDRQIPLQAVTSNGVYCLAGEPHPSVDDGAYENALSPHQKAMKTASDQDFNPDQYDNVKFVPGAGKHQTTAANTVESVYDNEVILVKMEPTAANDHTYNTLREVTEPVPVQPTSPYDVLDRSQVPVNDVTPESGNPQSPWMEPTAANDHTYNTLRKVTEPVPVQPTSPYDVLDRSQVPVNDVIPESGSSTEQAKANAHQDECTYDNTPQIAKH
ncbi:mucin-2-like [Sycon ciliatum]|uniref:mucin-2-like n=1 Tax=Sycon ciliatum TaxID=27933 RepID=UPI0031F65A86